MRQSRYDDSEYAAELISMRILVLAFVTISMAGCGNATSPSLEPLSGNTLPAHQRFKTPVVIAYDVQSERLEYWPEQPHGGTQPKYISPALGISDPRGMVADGDVVTIASFSPAELFSYDVDTGATSTIADPFGNPVDVAIDTKGALYALHGSNVGVFPAGSSSSAYELSCEYITGGAAVAIDNEGDVFVNGYGPNNFLGVVEYPAGSSGCTKVPIKRAEVEYATGLGIDPKTDNLIVVNNPQACAGGHEGVMTVYQRPYGPRIVEKRNLHANCPGAFRLNSTSSVMLFTDTLPELRVDRSSGACRTYSCVDQRSYPNAKDHATYTGANSLPAAITTIPNTLPN